MKYIMVVPKAAWGKEDYEIEEIIAKEKALEETKRLQEKEEKLNSPPLVQTVRVVKTLKETVFEIISK